MFAQSLFLLLDATRPRGKRVSRRLFDEVLAEAERSGSRLQRVCFEGALLLRDGQALACLDLLRANDLQIGVDELNVLVLLAAKLKEVGFRKPRTPLQPRILQPLCEFGPSVLPANLDAQLNLFNALAGIYGNMRSVNELFLCQANKGTCKHWTVCGVCSCSRFRAATGPSSSTSCTAAATSTAVPIRPRRPTSCRP